MQLPLLQSSDRNRWRTDPEGKTVNGGFAGVSERLLSTPSTPCGYLQPYLCSCGNGDRGALLSPTLSGLSPQPSSTLSNLLTLWSRAEKDTGSQSAANDAKQVGARSEWSKFKAQWNPTALFKAASIPGETPQRSLHCFLCKNRGRDYENRCCLRHVKATDILTQFPASLTTHGGGRLVFPENHHTSVSGCYSIRATRELDGNFASWVPPWNLHFDKIPNHKLMFARYQATAHWQKCSVFTDTSCW